MTDLIDQAQEAEAWYRSQALDAASARDVMTPCERCYNCAADISAGCFCDPDCRDDYEKRVHGSRFPVSSYKPQTANSKQQTENSKPKTGNGV